jgi:molecular chaperone HscB
MRTLDPFETLGIARSFDLDLPAVEKTYRQLSRALHPDRHASASQIDRRDALARAVEVNEAWRIVRDPIQRAEALLSLSGIAVGGERESTRDFEFLEEMLEQREALQQARRACDRGAVEVLAMGVRARSTEAERRLSEGLAVGAKDRLVETLGKMRFYRRFLDEVSVIEDELV